MGLFTAAHCCALLLANLRSHFAEFLGNSSLAHLRILSLPTCVGFGTGRCHICARSFSWKLESYASLLDRSLSFTYHSLHPVRGFSFRTCYFASPTIHSVGHTILLRHSITMTAGTGISTCFPSTTPFGLALGPDLPRADEPSPGILGLSVCRILTYISLLTPAFSLPYSPPLFPVWLLRVWNAPLPLQSLVIRSFGNLLSPGTFSAQGHSTSELLRTL